ncbi:MAG: T9SS type A sorting domain-containing protein [Dysgonomonas sp.]
MKYIIYLTLSLLFSPLFLTAQTFDTNDKEGLRIFLRQPSSVENKLNLECIGLSVGDTLNWNTSEDWIHKIQNTTSLNYIDWEWNQSRPNRLKRLEIKKLDVDNSSAPSLSGVLDCGLFSELEYLDCSNNKISGLRLNQNFNLKELNCSRNDLAYLNVAQNVRLSSLDCSYNKISSLDLMMNANLGTLNCSGNMLSELDIASNIFIETLYCSDNRINKIDLPVSNYLKYLNCSDNRIANINVNNNTSLEFLSCSNNQLSNLDISGNTDLAIVYCGGNALSNLDVSDNLGLNTLYCSDNQLSSIDLSKNILLEYFFCSDNQITELNVTGNEKLKTLYCNNNNLENIDVTQNINLEHLYCSGNKIKDVFTSSNEKLMTFHCADNLLNQIDLAHNPNLISLNCSYNKLNSLDLFQNTKLGFIDCSNNQIVNLELNSLTDAFSTFVCNNNDLKFSTLPIDLITKGNLSSLVYAPQNIINGDEYASYEIIDLSSEYKFNEKTTSYTWVDDSDNAVSFNNKGEGLFSYRTEEDEFFTCRMVNATFPDLTLEYRVMIQQDTLPLGVGNNGSDRTNIYYDPQNKTLYITGEDEIKSILLIDMQGRVLQRFSPLQKTAELSFEKLNQGVYIVQVSMSSGKGVIRKIRK